MAENSLSYMDFEQEILIENERIIVESIIEEPHRLYDILVLLTENVIYFLQISQILPYFINPSLRYYIANQTIHLYRQYGKDPTQIANDDIKILLACFAITFKFTMEDRYFSIDILHQFPMRRKDAIKHETRILANPNFALFPAIGEETNYN